MMRELEMTEHLFSYGTLQKQSVQLATFGRTLQGSPDALAGYELSVVKIEDPAVVAASGETHHPIVRFTGVASHFVTGTVLNVTSAELQKSDAYEVDEYERISVVLASGVRAWVYVVRTPGV